MTAYERVEKIIHQEGKACIIHPTGTGKTYIAFKLIETHPDKNFVWLGPSDYIYNLQIKKLKEQQGIVFENVRFCTYSWLMHNEDAIEELNPDYIILDEFHRVGARHWSINVNRLMETYPEAKVFGMTATNIRYLDNRRDMANEIFAGHVCSEFDIVEAMVRGYLPIPTYVVCSYYYKDKIKEYEDKIAEIKSPAIKAESMDTLQKLKRAIEQADGMDEILYKHIKKKNGRFIVFCPSLEKMYEMMTKVPEWFAKIDRLPHVYCVHSYNIDSNTDFQKFQEDDSEHIKLLFTIDMLNEGVHVDGVDGVILLRTTISPIVYKQQIGRALATDAKDSPLIFDVVNNFDSLYSIKELEQEFETKRGKLVAEGEYVTYENFKIVDELRDSRRLFAVLIKNLESTWEMYYRELINYLEEHGNINVPRRYITPEGLYLGKWLNRQRGLYRENKLEEEKANHLRALGVDFRTNNESGFEEWIRLLIEYNEEHGNYLIPNDYETTDGKKLGNAVFNYRSRYAKGTLPEEYVERLESIGFVWSAFEETWNQNYRLAEAYYKEHGNLDIGKRYVTEDGTKLGLWLHTQRSVYHKRVSGNLTEQQIERLNAIHMIWDKEPLHSDFNKNIEALKAYVGTYGNALVQKDYVAENGIALGRWIMMLRMKNNSGKLEKTITQEQKAMLDDLCMIWDVNDYYWNQNYQDAKKYYEEYGHLYSIPKTLMTENGTSLSTWLNRQKAKYHHTAGSATLTEEQIKQLEAIGIQWDLRTDRSFERGIAAFIAYKKKHGSAQVPVAYKTEEGYNLGKWCARMRDEKKKGTILLEREEYLNKLGFLWDYTDYYWERMYETAKAYYEYHGHLNVPWNYISPNGAKLGQWIADMRKRYRNAENSTTIIRNDQISRLEDIGIQWE